MIVRRVISIAAIVAGFSGTVYFLVTSRVPLVLAFVPMGEVSRTDQPAWFWTFVALGVVLGLAGVVGVVTSPNTGDQ